MLIWLIKSFYFDFVLSNCPSDIIHYFLTGPSIFVDDWSWPHTHVIGPKIDTVIAKISLSAFIFYEAEFWQMFKSLHNFKYDCFIHYYWFVLIKNWHVNSETGAYACGRMWLCSSRFKTRDHVSFKASLSAIFKA